MTAKVQVFPMPLAVEASPPRMSHKTNNQKSVDTGYLMQCPPVPMGKDSASL